MTAEALARARRRAGALLQEWERCWNAPGLAGRLRLEISTRMSSAAGRCYPERGLVRLAAFLFDGDGAFPEEVLCHEAAHLVVYERHGRSARPHGPEWKALVEAAGFPARVRIPLNASVRDRRRPAALWRHDCPVCGAVRLARRPVRRWRCRACTEAGRSGVLIVRRMSPPPETRA